MGKRGPRPRPAHIQLLNGARESRVNRDEPQPTEDLIAPPVEMSEPAQRVWNRLAPDLIARKVLTPWDVDQFVVFCDTVAVYHECKQLMAGEYIAQGAAGGKIKNPLWQIMRDCQAMMAQIGSRYGLTPHDRASLKVDADEAPTGGAERLLS